MDYGISDECIVCFAGEDWWYHHPHSKNHILKRLAQDNKVLFVNSITMGLPSMSNPDFFVKIRRKLKSYMKWLRKVPEGLWVMTPINLPFYGSRLGRKLSFLMLVSQLRIAMKIIGIRKPVLWVAIPPAADLVGHLDEKLVLYQVSDKYEANEDSALSANVIRSLDQKLRTAADVVMFSGRKLFAESADPHRYFLEQAVDFEHFSNPAEIAPEVAHLSGPVLGYFGAMDFVMDTDLMAEVSRRRPEWQWVMIGFKSKLVQLDLPNVHFFGARPYADLPRYIARFDVCVLPWRQDNDYTNYGSAIKVREYLATGKPVVISPLFEYLKTPGLRIYRSVDEFITLVEDSLAHDTPEKKQQRQDAVRDSTWDTRARQVGELVKSIMAGRRYTYKAAAIVSHD